MVSSDSQLSVVSQEESCAPAADLYTSADEDEVEVEVRVASRAWVKWSEWCLMLAGYYCTYLLLRIITTDLLSAKSWLRNVEYVFAVKTTVHHDKANYHIES
jgi:hypothetical protein